MVNRFARPYPVPPAAPSLPTHPLRRCKQSGGQIYHEPGGSFGIALLGLYSMFNSTSTQMSFSACAMYIVGTVVGVLLMQVRSS
jgi:hypothetical protein